MDDFRLGVQGEDLEALRIKIGCQALLERILE